MKHRDSDPCDKNKAENLPNSLSEDMPLGMMIKMVSHLHENDVRQRHEAIGMQHAFGPIIMMRT